MTLPESVRALIATGPPAYLTTLNADGSPQVTLVWVGTENDEIVIPHMRVWQKVKNMRRDPRVALALLGPGKNPPGVQEYNLLGLQEYLVVYGKARITEGGAAALIQRLRPIYMGPNVKAPPTPYQDKPGYITRITPDRFTGIGPWTPTTVWPKPSTFAG
jgi:PPOX class probable F420-dependent enzyme